MFVQDGAKSVVSTAANGTYYAHLDPRHAALFYIDIDGIDTGNAAFQPVAGHATPLETLVSGLRSNTVFALAGSGGAPVSISGLYETIGFLDDPELLYRAAAGGSAIELKDGVDFVLDEGASLVLDGGIVTSGTGSIRLAGAAVLAGDSVLDTSAGSGAIVLDGAVTAAGTTHLTLFSGTGGLQLNGRMDLGKGDLILESQGPVSVTNAVIARGLALVGQDVDYQLTHADNAVSVLAGDARSIHYEQAGSLAIGSVGGIEGLASGDSVQVMARDDKLTVAETVRADGDVTFAGYGVIVDVQGSVEGATVAMQAGNGGMALGGRVTATTTVTLDSTGVVTQDVDGGIMAENLLLRGEGRYDLRGVRNAVQTLAGDVGSIHYEQSGSLAIGTVGTTAGLHANDRVQVALTGGASDLTVEQGVSAQGSGYAIVLAAGGRFVNTAGPNPFDTSDDGYYLVFSADHTQRQLGDMASPGNLFGWTYDDDAVDGLVDEFGHTLGSRMVYASRPTLVSSPLMKSDITAVRIPVLPTPK